MLALLFCMSDERRRELLAPANLIVPLGIPMVILFPCFSSPATSFILKTTTTVAFLEAVLCGYLGSTKNTGSPSD